MGFKWTAYYPAVEGCHIPATFPWSPFQLFKGLGGKPQRLQKSKWRRCPQQPSHPGPQKKMYGLRKSRRVTKSNAVIRQASRWVCEDLFLPVGLCSIRFLCKSRLARPTHFCVKKSTHNRRRKERVCLLVSEQRKDIYSTKKSLLDRFTFLVFLHILPKWFRCHHNQRFGWSFMTKLTAHINIH